MKKVKALTYIEVLVSIAIVSIVFVALLQMAITSLIKAKKLETEDRMRNYAIEALQVLTVAKDRNWNDTEQQLVPAENNKPGQAYISYDEQENSSVKKDDSSCFYNTESKVIEGCDEISPISPDPPEIRQFGRLILRTDNGNDPNSMEITIVIACLSDKCTSDKFAPFIITTVIYRTGG